MMLENVLFLGGSGGYQSIVIVTSIVALIAVIIVCSWCFKKGENANQEANTPTEGERLIDPEQERYDKEEEKSFQKRIRENYVDLGNLLDTESGLLSTLYSKGVLNIREKQTIQNETIEFKRNEKLLDMLMTKSELQFSIFIDALQSTNQKHIARTLLKHGALLPLHIKIETAPAIDIKRFEIDLARRFTEASAKILRGDTNLDDLEQLMQSLLSDVRQKKAELVKTIPDRSVLLYFFCPTPQVLDQMYMECHKGELGECIKSVVTVHFLETMSLPRSFFGRGKITLPRDVPSHRLPIVRLQVNDEDYRRYRKNFPQDEASFPGSVTLILRIRRSFKHWRSYNQAECNDSV